MERRALAEGGGVVFRGVSDKLLRVADVPKASRIVRDTEKDRELDVARDGFGDQLRQIARAAPFAAGIGMGFGLYPAWKASQLDPIDALRYE